MSKKDKKLNHKVQDENQQPVYDWKEDNIDDELEQELMLVLSSLYKKHDLYSISSSIDDGEVCLDYAYNNPTDGWVHVRFDL